MSACSIVAAKCILFSNKRISGDTTPCEALEKLGNGAELVIHEANFDDTDPENSEAMIALAAKKKHSTTRQVVLQSHGRPLIHKFAVAPSRAAFA
jgi:ribonuclease BN (tRNA processing enzyme)